MDYLKHKEREEQLAEFFKHCHSKVYPAKTMLARPGDIPDRLYYIREGSISICVENEEGEELIVAYLNQGDFIGEVGYFHDNINDRMSVVKARTDCRTEEISYQTLKALSKTELKGCYPYLLETLGEQMSKRLLTTTRKATNMAFMDVSGRVEEALRDLAAQPDAMRHEQGRQIKIIRQEVSRIVGCSREMVGRVLKELQERGILWAHGKTMVLFDEDHRGVNASIKKVG